MDCKTYISREASEQKADFRTIAKRTYMAEPAGPEAIVGFDGWAIDRNIPRHYRPTDEHGVIGNFTELADNPTFEELRESR